MKWYLLIHQLPPRPIYLRAKIGNRLDRVGGLALKNSVYVLPERDECLEDLQWIAQEAVAGGGSAFLCRAELVEGVSDEALVGRFRKQAADAYEALKDEIAKALDEVRERDRKPVTGTQAGVLLRLKKRLEEISGIDFFGSPFRKEAEAMLRSLETKLNRGKRGGTPRVPAPLADLIGRTWVTRRDPRVDRLASAWLIRRFIDPGARFRFVGPLREARKKGELGFDFVGGDFTHEGDHCTFETLLARTGITDPALSEIAEIVHDVDLKDAKYGRPDAPGVRQLIQGLVHAHPEDEDRLASGFSLFDHLYASFEARSAPARRGAKGRVRPAKRPHRSSG